MRVTFASSVERLAAVTATLTALGVALPVASLAWLALTATGDVWPHLLRYVLPQALRDSALLIAGVSLVAGCAGGGAAWTVSTFDFPGRRALLWLLPLPLAIPTYISAYVYVDLFEPLGLVHRIMMQALKAGDAAALLPSLRSLPGAAWVMGLVLYPYVYLATRAALDARSAEPYEAARTLGAGPLTVLVRITLPMARPALAVGLALVMLETLNDIGASEYLGVRTLTVAVFTTWLNRGSLAGAAQLSLLMVAIVACAVWIEQRGRREGTAALSAETPHLLPRVALTGTTGWTALVLIALPAALGFGLPFAYLVGECLRRAQAHRLIDAALWRDLGHTLLFASTATLVALTLAATLAAWQRFVRGALAPRVVAVACLGYAFPGLVLALGLLPVVLGIDNAVAPVVRALGGSVGLLLVGSGGAVVIAYVIRFLAVPVGLLRAGYARIPRDYDDSALSAGARRSRILRTIHAPLLQPALGGAAILVFVDCLKELPATLLLRPLNVETLATSIYQYASRGSFEDGAAAALLIVAASIPPVLWLARAADVTRDPA